MYIRVKYNKLFQRYTRTSKESLTNLYAYFDCSARTEHTRERLKSTSQDPSN